MSQVDAVGEFAHVLERVLGQNGSPRPEFSPECRTQLNIFGEYEMLFSYQPRGYCSYCCQISKPERYVNLFFTSQALKGNPVKLKMSRKRGALHQAGFNSSSPTVIYIHGFTEHGLGPSSSAIIKAYLSRPENYNIIIVDWGELAAFPWYPQAVEHVKLVGGILAKFLRFYNGTGELPIANLHVVGFSLGAHVAGLAGKYFRKEKIPRIVGLDPASPLFLQNGTAHRLAEDDAEFVDCVHTDGGKFGFPFSICQADFYPNGGTFLQPGCEPSQLAENSIFYQFGTCSHLRAWKFYAESVSRPTSFPATKCGIMKNGKMKKCGFVTDGYMGMMANKSETKGDYYLTTTNREPFAKSAKLQEADMKPINLML